MGRALWGGPQIPLLLEAGADTSLANVLGDTPLHCAALVKDSTNAKLLLRFGAEANAQNAQGDAPAHVAAREMDAQTLKLILEAGGDVDKQMRKMMKMTR